ncbi:MAG TPA: hypothetical protein VIT88_07490 [Pyrinomonadaceae bacterium]
MAISSELSSEIATALFAKERSSEEISKLKDVLLEVHATLQSLSNAAPRKHNEIPPAARAASSKTST